MAAAIRRALGEGEGGLLAFLPGVAEIERTAERLERLPADVDLHRLHGSLDPAAQRAAIAPAAAGPAQARPRHLDRRDQPDPRRGPDRGRFGAGAAAALRPRRRPHPPGHRARQPGRGRPSAPAAPGGRGRAAVYRLWEEAATQSLPRFDPPEILEADLSRAAARLRDLGRRRSAHACAGSIRRRPRRSTRRASGCSRSARSTRRPADRRTAAPSPSCRCRRASPTC